METGTHEKFGTVDIYVLDESGSHASLGETRIEIFALPEKTRTSPPRRERSMRPEGELWATDADGHFRRDFPEDRYRVEATAFGIPGTQEFRVRAGCTETVTCTVDLGFEVNVTAATSEQSAETPKEGSALLLSLSWPRNIGDKPTSVSARPGAVLPEYNESMTDTRIIRQYVYHAAVPGRFEWTARLSGGSFAQTRGAGITQPNVQTITGNVGVAMQRTATAITGDLALWQAILNSTDRLSFNNYLRFMNLLFCDERDVPDLPVLRARALPEEADSLPGRAARQTAAPLHRFGCLSRCEGGDRGLRHGELRHPGDGASVRWR